MLTEMLLSYVRPEARFSAARQLIELRKLGVNENKVYVEEERTRDDGYPIRDKLVQAMRVTSSDGVAVSHFHRLASTAADLNAILKAIKNKGGFVIEASTGRRSDSSNDLVDMIFEATEFYARRGLTTEEATRLGTLGGEASPATKRKNGHMPLHDMQTILNDHTITVEQACAKIRRDRRYKTKISQATIYRWARDGKLKLRPRLAGRLPKPQET